MRRGAASNAAAAGSPAARDASRSCVMSIRARFAFRSDERAAIRSRHRIGGQVSRTHGATSQTVEAVRAKSIAFDGR
ncbi:hypothetical protein AQ902_18290 [Burkholderia pseudomallei]|nr:hypothetical protein SZ30_28005 [Burkholderia pseudomallei]ONB65108.1 hypothetical protein AQ902_18290 [Burkholderia pseudomallei]ONC04390.1 hypothetical protein AQ909_02895 [Burkholderia pseudomallei]